MTTQSYTEKLHLKNLYACVLAKGELSDGNIGYCYFGVFLNELNRIRLHLSENDSFNPKDFDCIVLVSSDGEQTDEVKQFMRRKFSFAEDRTILEVSEKRFVGNSSN